MGLTSDEFEQLYRTHAREILGYLGRRTGSHDAQDLLAETFLIAWRRRNELPATDTRRAWLYGTARKLLLAHRRQDPHEQPLTELMPIPGDDAKSLGEQQQIVHVVLAELPEADRELLTLTAWEHLSVAEAGQALGLRPSTARVRLHRLRRRLAADPRLAAAISKQPAPTTADPKAASDTDPPTPSPILAIVGLD